MRLCPSVPAPVYARPRHDERASLITTPNPTQTARPGRLRVVAWNIASNPEAWRALDAVEPDICLLNEAVIPEGRSGIWSPEGTFGRDGARRRWTAAVVSTLQTRKIGDARPRWRYKARSVPLECSRPGSWAAASVEAPFGSVSAIALYGLMDELSDASVHRSLSELSGILDDPAYNRLVVLGGDLNTGTQWPEGDSFLARDRNVLERIEAFGLVDCLRARREPGRLDGCTCAYGEGCVHVRTRRDQRYPDVPYQTDYLFASRELASMLSSCEVLASEEWFALSDHAPIVADFRAT